MDKRLQSRVPVNITILGNSQAVPLMFSRDISRGGLSLESFTSLTKDGPIQEGIELNLNFSLPFGSSFTNVGSKVVWVRHDHQDHAGKPISLIGVQFTKIDEKLATEIETYLSRLQPLGAAVSESAAQEPPATMPALVAEAAAITTSGEIETAKTTVVEPGSVPSVEPVTLSFVPKTHENYFDFLTEPADANSTPGKDLLDQYLHRCRRQMLPKERNFLKNNPQHVVSQLICLAVKFEVEGKYIEEQIKLNKFGGTPDDIKSLTQHYVTVTTSQVEQCRKQVSTLYSAGKAQEGQELSGYVNRIDTQFKRLNQTLSNYLNSLSGDKNQFVVRSIKFYFEAISKAAQKGDNIIFSHTLEPWELQAFLPSDTYWSKDERALVAGLVALYSKIGDEATRLVEQQGSGTSIAVMAIEARDDNQKLFAKLGPRAQLMQETLKQAGEAEKLDKLKNTLARLNDISGQLGTLVETTRGELVVDTSGLVDHYSQKLYDGDRKKPAEKAAPQKSKSKKGPVKLSLGTRIFVFSAPFIVFGIATFWALPLIRGSNSTYDNAAYKVLFPIKSMMVSKVCMSFNCEKWLFIDVDSEAWSKLTMSEKQATANALWQQALKDKIPKIELRSNKRTVALTNWETKEKKLVLQVRK